MTTELTHEDCPAYHLHRPAPLAVPQGHTEEGIKGWGEPVVEGRADTVAPPSRKCADYLIGKSAADRRSLAGLHRGGFYRGGAILMSAIAGIEQALWDIKGKARSAHPN